jgi:hypothetical protein
MAVGESGTAGQEGRSRRAHGTSEPRLALVRRRREGAKGAAGRQRAPVGGSKAAVRLTGGTVAVESGADDRALGVAIAGLRVIGMEGAGKQQREAQHPRDPPSDRRAPACGCRARSHLEEPSWQ